MTFFTSLILRGAYDVSRGLFTPLKKELPDITNPAPGAPQKVVPLPSAALNTTSTNPPSPTVKEKFTPQELNLLKVFRKALELPPGADVENVLKTLQVAEEKSLPENRAVEIPKAIETLLARARQITDPGLRCSKLLRVVKFYQENKIPEIAKALLDEALATTETMDSLFERCLKLLEISVLYQELGDLEQTIKLLENILENAIPITDAESKTSISDEAQKRLNEFLKPPSSKSPPPKTSDEELLNNVLMSFDQIRRSFLNTQNYWNLFQRI